MLLDNDAVFGANADGLYVKRAQVIPQEFLDQLKSIRDAQADFKARQMNQVASVPTHVVELWLRQGRDVWNASPREIVQWLEKDNLQAFITSPGRV